MKIKDLHIKVTEDLFKRIKNLAQQDRRKQSEVLTIALENYLNLRKA